MDSQFPPQLSSWTFRQVAWATFVLSFVVFCSWLIFRFSQVIFILFIAIVMGTVIRPAVTWLYRRGLPRIAGVILVYLILLALIIGFLLLVFPLIFLLRKPKQALRSLIIVVAAVVLVFIAYQFLASDELLNLVNYNGPDNVPTTLKIVDTGLFLTYFLLVIAFGAILYHEISSSIK